MASVNSFGVVSGVGQGTATIYYSVPNSCGGATESVNVTVSPQVTAGTISGPGQYVSTQPLIYLPAEHPEDPGKPVTMVLPWLMEAV